MSQVIELRLGAHCEPLEEQLHGQLPVEMLRKFQQDADAVTRLVVRGIIPGSIAKQCRRVLAKRIVVELNASIVSCN